MKQKLFFTILTGILLIFSIAACGQKESGPVLECPFTEVGWEATAEDVAEAEAESLSADAAGADSVSSEGEAGNGDTKSESFSTNAGGSGPSTYDSVYGGTCYTWPKEYNGLMGTVKYMFDDEEKLMCVAWAYGCDDADELLSLYESINGSVNEKYGESGYAADHPGNYGNVWYLETGDIVLTTMITAENKALQYAYLHPLVSNKQQSPDS